MVLAHVVRLEENNISHVNNVSAGSKAPVYISDKRAKFSRKLNKKWVRVLTVFGYLISICIPAAALSVYYLGFWDPQYKTRIPANETVTKDGNNGYDGTSRYRRNVDSQLACPPCSCKFQKLREILMSGAMENIPNTTREENSKKNTDFVF